MFHGGVDILPSPTTALHVSGTNRAVASRARADAAAVNQKMDGHGHLIRRSPLIMGAMLGGVFRLRCFLVSTLPANSFDNTHKTEIVPVKPPRSAGVVRSPMRPYAME